MWKDGELEDAECLRGSENSQRGRKMVGRMSMVGEGKVRARIERMWGPEHTGYGVI